MSVTPSVSIPNTIHDGDFIDAAPVMDNFVALRDHSNNHSHTELDQILVGAIAPEGAVTAPAGTVYIHSTGGTSTTLYLKEVGSGNTGWQAVYGKSAIDALFAARVPPYLNIKDYGAVGDGVTDDTAAIQAAIDASITNSSMIVFPGGIYAIRQLILRNNIRFMPLGNVTIKRKSGTTDDLFVTNTLTTPLANFVLLGFTIDNGSYDVGSHSTTTTGSHTLPVATLNVADASGFLTSGTLTVGSAVLRYTGTTGTSFTGVTVVSGSGTITAGTGVIPQGNVMILPNGNSYITIRDNHFANLGDATAIQFGPGASSNSYCTVENNIFEGSAVNITTSRGLVGPANCVYMSDWFNYNLNRNTFIGTGTNPLVQGGGSGKIMEAATIHGNHVKNIDGTAFIIRTAQSTGTPNRARKISIVGNEGEDIGLYRGKGMISVGESSGGTGTYGSFSDVAIVGNTLRHFGTLTATISSVNSPTLGRPSSGHGIFVGNDTPIKGFTIANNVIDARAPDGTIEDRENIGISVTGSTQDIQTDITITGNTIIGCGLAGIYLTTRHSDAVWDINNVLIADNLIDSCLQYISTNDTVATAVPDTWGGITIGTGAEQITIKNNTVTNTGRAEVPLTTTVGSHTLPVATLNVVDTSLFKSIASKGNVYVAGQLLAYTGITSTSFTGISGGTAGTVIADATDVSQMWGYSGIHIEGGNNAPAREITIESNKCTNTVTPAYQRYGISVGRLGNNNTWQPTNIYILRNDVRGNTIQGVYDSNANIAGVYVNKNHIYVPSWSTIVTKTVAYTVQIPDDDTIFADATSGALAITIPAGAYYPQYELRIKKIDSSANAVTITPVSGNIEGVASLVLRTQNEYSVLKSDGTNWQIMSIAAVNKLAISTKTTTYTIVTTDDMILADATSGTFTITLPTAIGLLGKQFTIKRINTNANNVTIGTTSSQTIDGSTTYIITTPNQSINVVSDGANWKIL